MQKMDLLGVRVEMPSNAPMVLLREKNEMGRIIPIYIGAQEATAIALALDGVATPRPMTHDLMRDVLLELSVKLEYVVITELRDKTFYAELHFKGASNGHVLSSRPSDAIALAVRLNAPIYAEEDVVEEVGFRETEMGSGEKPEEVVEEFMEFLDSVTPEDFEDPNQ